jgi:hypothetical protein
MMITIIGSPVERLYGRLMPQKPILECRMIAKHDQGGAGAALRLLAAAGR